MTACNMIDGAPVVMVNAPAVQSRNPVTMHPYGKALENNHVTKVTVTGVGRHIHIHIHYYIPLSYIYYFIRIERYKGNRADFPADFGGSRRYPVALPKRYLRNSPAFGTHP